VAKIEFSEDDLRQCIEAARISLNLPIVGDWPDAFTAVEWSEKFGLSESGMRKKLKKAVGAGTWEQVTVRRERSGVLRATPAYRLVNGKPPGG
jgi:hypothetical protein